MRFTSVVSVSPAKALLDQLVQRAHGQRERFTLTRDARAEAVLLITEG